MLKPLEELANLANSTFLVGEQYVICSESIDPATQEERNRQILANRIIPPFKPTLLTVHGGPYQTPERAREERDKLNSNLSEAYESLELKIYKINPDEVPLR